MNGTEKKTTIPPIKKHAVTTADDLSLAKAPEKPAGDKVFVGLNRATGILFDLAPNGDKRVHIYGNAEHLRGREMGILPVGAFGMTEVNRADWEEIAKRYGEMEIFKNGLIFAADSKADFVAMAEERKSLRHGLEPIDPADKTLKTKPAERS